MGVDINLAILGDLTPHTLVVVSKIDLGNTKTPIEIGEEGS